MEERLFWIGVTMGLYAWGTRYGSGSGILETRTRTAAWHALFCFIAGFAMTLGRLYSSAFYALRDTKTPLRFAMLRVALTAALGWIFALPLIGASGALSSSKTIPLARRSNGFPKLIAAILIGGLFVVGIL